WLERVTPRCQRRAAWAVQRGIGLAHHAERVLIEAEPDMKPMLLDPLSTLLVAAARTLAPEPPAELMHGDLVLRAQLLGVRQLEGRDDRRHASAKMATFCLSATTASSRRLTAREHHPPRGYP